MTLPAKAGGPIKRQKLRKTLRKSQSDFQHYVKKIEAQANNNNNKKGFLIKKREAPYTHRENVRGKSFVSQKPDRKNSVMIPTTSATSSLLRAERESKTEM